MSKLKTKTKLTKAGVALNASARSKLQQVARWITDELKGNQDPRIILGYHGGIVTYKTKNLTVLTPFGVLVQMFDPFNLVDMKELDRGVCVIDNDKFNKRVAKILEISLENFYTLLWYVYREDWNYEHYVKVLRGLK